MRRSVEYRKSAAQCWRLAQKSTSPEYRALLLSLAGTYVMLADQIQWLGTIRADTDVTAPPRAPSSEAEPRPRRARRDEDRASAALPPSA